MNYREKCLRQKLNFCRVCGSDDELEVHHKDGDRTNNSLDNLVPVCPDCHNDIHSMGEVADPIKELREQIEYEKNTQAQYTIMLTKKLNRDILRQVESTPDINRSNFIRIAIRNELARIGYSGYEIKQPRYFNYSTIGE